MEKQPFFRAAMAGLGKYHMGGYGRIGVYRVKRYRTGRYQLKPCTLMAYSSSSITSCLTPTKEREKEK